MIILCECCRIGRLEFHKHTDAHKHTHAHTNTHTHAHAHVNKWVDWIETDVVFFLFQIVNMQISYHQICN